MTPSPADPLTPAQLRERLIRNMDEALAGPQAQRFSRPPRYTSTFASLTEGTAATQMGCSVDVVPPANKAAPTTCTTRKKRCSSSCKAKATCAWRASCYR
ncbi:hypothetical protein [Ideonella paludis]|uniref:hypothetical protein n=1 Tax=Ideonella paludis TaxID=1233411 RepID=UPI00362CE355